MLKTLVTKLVFALLTLPTLAAAVDLRFTEIAPKQIVPGHGKVCDLAKAKRDTKDYLVLLRGHMKTALDKGLDLQRALDTLDQSRFKSLLNYELLKGSNASNTYLEMETE